MAAENVALKAAVDELSSTNAALEGRCKVGKNQRKKMLATVLDLLLSSIILLAMVSWTLSYKYKNNKQHNL